MKSQTGENTSRRNPKCGTPNKPKPIIDNIGQSKNVWFEGKFGFPK